jgi:hypothetical protein
MKPVLLLAASLLLFSCKKCDPVAASLNNTQWTLHYKNNSSFTFFAVSNLRFGGDASVLNYRNFDTVAGVWTQSEKVVSIQFDNGDAYSGSLVTDDSLSGTLTASASSGVWHAVKK